MKVGSTYFCNLDGAEIPAEENNHEFESLLIPNGKKGHAHEDCLGALNQILTSFAESYTALSALLNPEVPSAQKANRAARVQAKREKVLERVKPKKLSTGKRSLPKGKSTGRAKGTVRG